MGRSSFGPWLIFSQVIDGWKCWRIGRVKDTSQPVHGGNIEWRGGFYYSREEAEAVMKSLEGGVV